MIHDLNDIVMVSSLHEKCVGPSLNTENLDINLIQILKTMRNKYNMKISFKNTYIWIKKRAQIYRFVI